MLSVEDVNGILRLPLLGVIADEPDIIVTTNRGEPLALHRDNPTGAAYHAIAARVAGEDVPAPMPPTAKGSLSSVSARSLEESARDRFSKRLFGQPARALPRRSACDSY